VADLSIEDPPIEEVIRIAFGEGEGDVDLAPAAGVDRTSVAR
jgi:hypothetical protein